MSDSCESWETASQEELIALPVKARRKRKAIVAVKLRILHQLLYIVELLRMPRVYSASSEINEHEVYRQLQNPPAWLERRQFGGFYRAGAESEGHYPGAAAKSECDIGIDMFVSLIKNGIEARIYFVLDDGIASFIEHAFGAKVVEHCGRYDGNVIAVDKYGNMTDQTLAFSKKARYHRIFAEMCGHINNVLCRDGSGILGFRGTFSADETTPKTEMGQGGIFDELDRRRYSEVPTTRTKLQIHPFYTAESLCRKDEVIYPRGRPCGMLNGEKIYLRKNIQKIKTARRWYWEGRVLKGVAYADWRYADGEAGRKDPGAHSYLPKGDISPIKPYRIASGKCLYARFQTVPISVPSIMSGPMEAFHANFIPNGCVYIDAEPDICRLLDVKYSRCITGFRRGEPIMEGFFINKSDCSAVNEVLMEKEHYERTRRFNSDYECAVRDWGVLIRKTSLYLRVKTHLGG